MKRRRRFRLKRPGRWVWLLLAAAVAAAIAYFALRPAPPVALDPRQQWEARQRVVTQVISTLDRATLIGDSPTLGNPEAEVVLFEFSDFQCPYCAKASLDVKVFMDQHSDDVLFVYKHFPLSQIHPEALPAARAAWAAGQQQQFWLYHDGLFANQSRLGDPLYDELAQLIGLDREAFGRDRASSASQAAIERDLRLAQALALDGTPTFLMNDLLLPPGAGTAFFTDTLSKIQAALEAPPPAEASPPTP